MQILIPIRYQALSPAVIPVFVAGPILGGDDWQADFIDAFTQSLQTQCSIAAHRKIAPRLRFIVPCRWPETHRLSQHFATNYTVDDYGQDPDVESGTFWECFHLDTIIVPGSPGLVVFGLFPESESYQRDDGSPYGRDTYGELGRWPPIGRLRGAKNILVGLHPDWKGGHVFRRNEAFWPADQRSAEIHTVSLPGQLASWSLQRLLQRHVG